MIALKIYLILKLQNGIIFKYNVSGKLIANICEVVKSSSFLLYSRTLSYYFEPSWKPAGITSLQIPYKRILAHVIFLLNYTFRCIAKVKYSQFNEHCFVEEYHLLLSVFEGEKG